MNVKGFGIIQLMVAVGLGSVVSLGVINMMHFSTQNQKKIQFRNELVAIQTRFSEVLHNDKTFLNTVASSANPNMACLRNRTACASAHVSSLYAPTHDRIAIVHPATTDGRIFYDGRATSTAGFTEKGAVCTGFSATGAGNDACPIGFITNWYVNQAASTEGLALTINAKMVFNPSDTHPLKRLFYSPATDATIGSYDLSVTKRVRSLVDNAVVVCQQSGITLHNSATYTFYSTATAPAGGRCFQEARLCTVINNTPVLSGTYTHPTCVQNCSGQWSSCSATCGGGTRTYTVNVPANQWGVTTSCAAADGATEACNTQPCAVNCVGDWGACVNGTRSYAISTPAAHGGANCSFAQGQTQSCGVNCVGSWGGCVNGSQTFTITTPASGGGASCTGTHGQVRTCGTNCIGSWGGCSSGSQSFTITTPASGGGTACTATNGQTRSCGTNCVGAWGNCAGGVQTYSISSPASGGGAACEATSGATRSCGTNCVGNWGSCSNGSQTFSITTPASGGGTACTASNGQTRTCGTNCVGAWGNYGSCSATCGGGTQTRTFSITTPASGGGSACTATNGQTQSQSCNTQACNNTPVNCVGAWSKCTANGTATTYVVTTPAANGGAACSIPAGATATCSCSCYCGSWSCNYPYSGSGLHGGATTAEACASASGKPFGGCTPNGCVWVGGPGCVPPYP